jgi:hypothetical protein
MAFFRPWLRCARQQDKRQSLGTAPRSFRENQTAATTNLASGSFVQKRSYREP